MALNVVDVINSGGAARSYLWDVYFKFAGSDNFNARCTTSAQPNPDYQKIENNIRGFTIPEVGATNWNDIAFTLIENQYFEIIKGLSNLGRRIWNPETGTHPEPALASGNGEMNGMQIILNGLDGGPMVTWTLHGAVITGALEFPGTTSDKAGMYECTFTVAYAYATQD